MTVIEVGAEVQDAQHRDRRGVVLEMAERLASREMVKVRWAGGRVQAVPLSRLEIYTPRRDVRTLLREHSFGTIADFVRNYTHRKLLNPVDDTLYTLHASRTRLLHRTSSSRSSSSWIPSTGAS